MKTYTYQIDERLDVSITAIAHSEQLLAHSLDEAMEKATVSIQLRPAYTNKTTMCLLVSIETEPA